jgi:ElaB/YqjD/DUF883 family membrane-anchored ribosome-binding protein
MMNSHEKPKAIEKELRHIVDHAQALVDATSGELDDRIKSARAALKDRLEAAKIEYGALEDSIQDKLQAADEYVHVKPYYAIGAAALTGLLLGWFMSRK